MPSYYSYSKLNLFLNVVEKLPSGKHSLNSLFCLLNFGDYLSFSPSSQLEIAGMDIEIEQNLIYKAALLLRNHTNSRQGVRVEVQKNVPIFAGLGGGSADAALTLRVLNSLWRLDIPLSELRVLARALGSDVEAFLLPHSTLMIADTLEFVRVPRMYFVVLTPKIECYTSKIFARQATFSDERSAILSSKDIIKMANELKNDLQDTAFELLPDMKRYIIEAKNATISTRMSGSGSSIFAGFSNLDDARIYHRQIAESDLDLRLLLLCRSL